MQPTRSDDARRGGSARQRARQRELDRAADELFEKLVELRLAFHLQFGAGSSEGLFGAEDVVPIEPPTLRLFAQQAYDALLEPGLELPVQRLAEIAIHPRRLAAGLEGPMCELGAALAALGPEPCAQDAGETPALPARRTR